MNRRELVAGMMAAAASGDAQQPPEPGTLYIPPAHKVEDLALLHETMEEFSFVELVTAVPTLRITHVPVWLDRKAGAYGAIFGHIARHNPQCAAIEAHAAATIVFRGPHAYISPSWYTNPRAVPTWNFAAVHASGKLQPVSEPKEFHALLATLIAKSEDHYAKSNYDFAALPESYVSSMMQNILGFRLEIETIEGKFKLGQERSEADRESIVRHLKAASPERSIAALTESFYQRSRKP